MIALTCFVSTGVEAKVLSCEATKGNGRGWIPTEFKIDVSNDRKTANVISPVTDVFGAKPFEKAFLGSSLWSRGKGKSKMGDYYDYQLRLDLDSNDTEAKVVMTMQGYRDNELRFRCISVSSATSTQTENSRIEEKSLSVCNELLTQPPMSDFWTEKVIGLSNKALCVQFDVSASLFKLNTTNTLSSKKRRLGTLCREMLNRGVDCSDVSENRNTRLDLPIISWTSDGGDTVLEIDFQKNEIRYFRDSSTFQSAFNRAKRGQKIAFGLKTYPSTGCGEVVRDNGIEAYEVTASINGRYLVFPLDFVASELLAQPNHDLGIVVYDLQGTGWTCSDWDLDSKKSDWNDLKTISTVVRPDEKKRPTAFGSVQLRKVSNATICDLSINPSNRQVIYVKERETRGLDCAIELAEKNQTIDNTTLVKNSLMNKSDLEVCYHAVDAFLKEPSWSTKFLDYVAEAKRRELSPYYCKQLRLDFAEKSRKESYTPDSERDIEKQIYSKLEDKVICINSGDPYKREALRRGLSCHQRDSETVKSKKASPNSIWVGLSIDVLCMNVASDQTGEARQELKRRNADCGLTNLDSMASRSQTSESIEEIERLKQRLARLESKQKSDQQSISQDTQRPSIRITASNSDGARGTISGVATDNTGIAEVLVDGQAVAVDSSGRFTTSTFIPSGGIDIQITAYDLKGLSITEIVRLEREVATQVAKISFDRLNPTARRVKSNTNAIALIVGVAEYEKTAGAEYADRDAQVFYDYANLKLGIPRERIQTLVNDKADVVGLLSGINKWLKRSVRQGESDVYIFFAGHGLASDDGDTAYLIPYDGAPDFLERTAISRDEVFREVSSVNPRSVTVFLDTCYSGDTRGESRLIAGRPLSIKLQEQSLPKGFTVLTAAGGDQIAKPLKEAQHGMFSYFLMKGMEGGADSNSDNQITARELHTYVRENVVQQSGGSQVPELQGDAERVLVRFR